LNGDIGFGRGAFYVRRFRKRAGNLRALSDISQMFQRVIVSA
jgi:hypothetical protein